MNAKVMTRQKRIIDKLQSEFKPVHLDVINESDQHAGPSGRETHMRVVMVALVFEGQSRLERQRVVHELLREELSSGLHALSLRLYSPSEWTKMRETGEVPQASPDCAGANKNLS